PGTRRRDAATAPALLVVGRLQIHRDLGRAEALPYVRSCMPSAAVRRAAMQCRRRRCGATPCGGAEEDRLTAREDSGDPGEVTDLAARGRIGPRSAVRPRNPEARRSDAAGTPGSGAAGNQQLRIGSLLAGLKPCPTFA